MIRVRVIVSVRVTFTVMVMVMVMRVGCDMAADRILPWHTSTSPNP